MARLLGSIPGRLGVANVQGINQGPTGLAWTQTAALNPAALHKLTQDADYTDETTSFVGTMSTWLYTSSPTTNDVNMLCNFSDSVGIRTWVEIGVLGGFPSCRLLQPDNTLIVNVVGTTQVASGGWQNILMSWNVNTGSTYANEFHMYMNDVDVKPVTPTLFLTGNPVEWGTGNLFTTNYRLEFGNHGLTTSIGHSAIFLDWFRYTDFSVTANRRKFITAGGGQLPLGLDGSLPLGAQPPIYIDNDASVIQNNRGTIGTFNIGAGGVIQNFSPAPPVG